MHNVHPPASMIHTHVRTQTDCTHAPEGRATEADNAGSEVAL